jgi:O-acetyl-ADP-ribose deacetylase (regulator of RNase III)
MSGLTEEEARMRVKINQTILELVEGDITRQATGAIVNAANSGLRGGGGVDGAIHRAGGQAITEECRKIGGCPTGQAVITSGGLLPARYVIHAVGPVWRGGDRGEPELLASAYRNSLKVADEHTLKSISFPSLSTGAYGYPMDKAARIALKTVAEYLKGETSLEHVVLVLYGSGAFSTYREALEELVSADKGVESE